MINMLRTRWFRELENKQCGNDKELQLEPVSMNKVESIFLFLLFALPMALILVGFEKCFIKVTCK